MIAYLQGQIMETTKHRVVLLTPGGVGYAIAVAPALAAVCASNETLALHIYFKMSQDGIDLYGFADQAERDFFSLLMTVSGVGPKTAMSVLAHGPKEKIQSAIVRGDVAYLTDIAGLGRKTAERLVVELKSKIEVTDSAVSSGAVSVLADVIEALVGMGYERSRAKDVVHSLDAEEKKTETLLREALRKMR